MMGGPGSRPPGNAGRGRRSRPASAGERVFRVLLRAYPPRFRMHHRDDLVDFFRMDRERARARGLRATVRFWARTLMDLMRTAWTERRAEREDLREDGRLEGTPSSRPSRLGVFRLELRHAWRGLLRAPGFTALAVVTLALGVGATTTVFTVVHGVLLTPLAMPDAERVVQVEERERDNPEARMTAWGNYEDLRAAGVFEELAAWTFNSVTWTGGTQARRLLAREVTASFFPVVGLWPVLGRAFSAAEQVDGAHRVVVLGDGIWRSAFAADPGVLGSTIVLDGEAYTVVGVMQPGFDFPFDAEAWIPLRPVTDPAGLRAWHRHRMTGRLAPGTTLAGAREAAARVAERLEREHPATNEGTWFAVTPQLDEYVARARPTLRLLFGAVGFLLLLACVNIAGLIVARSVTRQQEVGVRVALGATRLRVAGLLVSEALLLGFMGGALGLALAVVGVDGALALASSAVPRAANVRVTAPVFGFAAILAVAAALLVSVLPAIRVSRLAGGGTPGARVSGGRDASRARRALVVAQLALALVLTAGAVLLTRSLSRIVSVDAGIDGEDVIMAVVRLPAGRYPENSDAARYFAQLLPELEALPGVTRASATLTPPIDPNGWRNSLAIRSRPVPESDQPLISYVVISPGYFETIGADLIEGREFEIRDLVGEPAVAIVNRAAVQRYWPDGDALGQEILGNDERQRPWLRIVGVVADVRQSLVEPVQPEVYVPIQHDRVLTFTLMVRTRPGMLEPVQRAMRDVIATRDADVPIIRMGMLSDRVALAVAGPRFNARLMSIFAGLALLLACVGAYGVLAYSFSSRRREIGIRTAVGAERGEVVALVLRETAAMALPGIALGLAGAIALSRVLSGMLFDIAPTDPVSLALVALVVAAVTCGAAVRPAWLAASIDPVEALRQD